MSCPEFLHTILTGRRSVSRQLTTLTDCEECRRMLIKSAERGGTKWQPSDRQLQISDRGNLGARNFNFSLTPPPQKVGKHSTYDPR